MENADLSMRRERDYWLSLVEQYNDFGRTVHQPTHYLMRHSNAYHTSVGRWMQECSRGGR